MLTKINAELSSKHLITSFFFFYFGSYPFCLSTETFPQTDRAADQRVQAVRTQRAQEMPIDTEWDLDDFLVALQARMGPIQRIGRDVSDAATRLCHILWLKEPAPKTARSLAEKMEDAEDRLIEWRQSAARVGADEALSWVLSWYETLELEKIKGVRAGSRWTEDPEWVKRRQEFAYFLVQYADINNFHEDPNAPADDQPEDDAEQGSDGEDAGESDGESYEDAESEEVDDDIEAEADPRSARGSDAPSSSGAAGP